MAGKNGGSSSTQEKRGPRTPKWVDEYLDFLALDPSPEAATTKLGIHRSTPYKYRKAHKWFADEWEAAIHAHAHENRAFLLKAGTGKIEVKQPNVTSAIFVCKGHFQQYAEGQRSPSSDPDPDARYL